MNDTESVAALSQPDQNKLKAVLRSVQGALKGQDPVTVAKFIDELSRNPIVQLALTDEYQAAMPEENGSHVAHREEAFEALEKLESFTDIWVVSRLSRHLWAAKFSLLLEIEINQLFSTSGTRIKLFAGDLIVLDELQDAFIMYFPKLKANFKTDTLLNELAEHLIGRKVPNSTGELLDKYRQLKKEYELEDMTHVATLLGSAFSST